jgi:hypothetical protein
MINEGLKFSGDLHIVLRGPDGQIKHERDEKNAIMNVGFAHIASRLKDATSPAMSYIGVGTSNTAVSPIQTDLLTTAGTRIGPDSGFPSLVMKNVAGDTIQFVTTFPAGSSTGALIEAGIFNNASVGGGTMLCRTVFAAGVVNKGALDSMTITWKVTAA